MEEENHSDVFPVDWATYTDQQQEDWWRARARRIQAKFDQIDRMRIDRLERADRYRRRIMAMVYGKKRQCTHERTVTVWVAPSETDRGTALDEDTIVRCRDCNVVVKSGAVV